MSQTPIVTAAKAYLDAHPDAVMAFLCHATIPETLTAYQEAVPAILGREAASEAEYDIVVEVINELVQDHA